MATARVPRLKTVLGRVSATLALGWLAGCTGSPTLAPAGTTPLPPTATPAESRSASSPVVYKGKPDLEAFVASLRGIGIEPVTTKGIDLRTFRFAEMVDLLELTLTLVEYQKPSGAKETTEIDLTSDGVINEGTINLALLPPAATGKEGAKIVIQIVPDGPGRVSTTARDVSPLWYATPDVRPRIQSGLDSGSKLPIRRNARGLKLIGYSCADQIEFRCRAVEPRGAGVTPGTGDADKP
jgi:hypothetical protein